MPTGSFFRIDTRRTFWPIDAATAAATASLSAAAAAAGGGAGARADSRSTWLVPLGPRVEVTVRS